MPILIDMIDASKIKQEAAKAEEKEKEMQKSFKNLQGGAYSNAQEAWRQEKQKISEQKCKESVPKHLLMFKTEAYFSIILEQTEKVSIACFAEFSNSRVPDLEGYKN